jgi:tetratricopeptide (TPR) repeat protein
LWMKSATMKSALSLSAELRSLHLLGKSLACLSQGKLSQGSQLIAEAIRPDNSEPVKAMVAECQRIGFIYQAREILARGDARLKTEDYIGAVQAYQSTDLAGLPRLLAFQLLHNKAVALVLLDKYEEAIAVFEEALSAVPNRSYEMQVGSITCQ